MIGGTLAHTFGLRQTFLISATFYLGGFILVMVGYRERRAPQPKVPAPAAVSASWRTLRQTPHFVLFVGTIFALQLVDKSFGPILPLYLREVGQSASRVPFLSGLIFSITAASAAVGNQATAWLLTRASVGLLVPAGAGVAATAAAAYGAGAPLPVLMMAGALFGAGLGVATTAIYTAASGSVSAASRGVAFGYLTRAYLVGLAISPVLAGLVGALSMKAVFIADAGALVFMAYTLSSRMKKD
jgi:MFS family permease